MTIWNGWEDEFLAGAGITSSSDNIRFLDDWHGHTQTNCTNNPVDLHEPEPGSSNCGQLFATAFTAQRYPSHSAAASAFNTQIHRRAAKPILDALQSGNPYTVSNPAQVGAALTAWGSQTFERPYLNESAGPPGQKPPPPSLKPAQALKGWRDLQRSINHSMPDALKASAKLRAQALRELSRARKVIG